MCQYKLPLISTYLKSILTLVRNSNKPGHLIPKHSALLVSCCVHEVPNFGRPAFFHKYSTIGL